MSTVDAYRGPETSKAPTDSHRSNRTEPDRLVVEFSEALSGSPEQAAAAVRTAAEGGVIEAQLVYGQWLLDGHGVAHNASAALQWFQHAARQGHPMALNMLGQCQAHGWGTTANPFMAAYWFRLAALGGLDWGMYNYATALTLGQGIPIDRPTALAWFRKAAALGHAKSMNMIGSFYEDGWEVEQNMALAAEFYLKAAKGGDFRGQFNTARLLMAEHRLAAAVPWLERIPQSATPDFLKQAAAWLQGMAVQHEAEDISLPDLADEYLAVATSRAL